MKKWVYFTECNWLPSNNGQYDAGVDCVIKKMSWSDFVTSRNPAGYIVK